MINALHQARNKLLKIIRSVLDEKKAMAKSNVPKGKKCMIDLLIEVEDEEGKPLDDEHITDLILTSLSAGFDSTPTVSLWGFLHLAGNPQVFEKAKVYIRHHVHACIHAEQLRTDHLVSPG